MQSSLPDIGVKINHDVLDHGYTPEQQRLVEELHPANIKWNRRTLRKIKRAVEEYPHLPVFKNYLYVLCRQMRRKKQAGRVMQDMLEQHPNYRMGRIAYAIELIAEKKAEEAAEMLYHFDLKKLAGQSDELHFTEVLKVWYVAARYHLDNGDLDQAEQYFEWMEELEPDSNEGEFVSHAIMLRRLQEGMERMKETQKLERWVKSFPTYRVRQSKEPPALPHPELQKLYQYSEENIPKKVIREILALPRESLRAGLRLILEDSYRRYRYFYKKYKQWNPDEQSFPIHALYFLREVGEAEDLDALFNLYRQGDKIIEYWFGDFFEELNWYALYALGQGQLDKLKAFVLEPNLYYFPRLVVSQALAQLAIHQPARREEVLDWFSDVFRYHLGHPKDKTRVDTAFLGWSACEVLNMRAKELWPLIEQMYEKGFIPHTYMGDLGELKKTLEKPFDEHDKKPLPRSIFEHYKGGHLSRRAQPAPDPELDAIAGKIKKDKIFSKLFKSHWEEEPLDEELPDEEPEYREPQQPAVSHKIGRNEPCPCGSGKKYKRCCGKK